MNNLILINKCSRQDCKNSVPFDGSKTCNRCKLANKRHKAEQRARKKANLANTRTEEQSGKKHGPDHGFEDSERPVQRQKMCHEDSRASTPAPESHSEDEDSRPFDNEPDESVSDNETSDNLELIWLNRQLSLISMPKTSFLTCGDNSMIRQMSFSMALTL